jgi:4-hydroxy-3-methylbut-2-enyl diphosphate reductase
MNVRLARYYGMCFGVRDALRKTHELAAAGPVTVLGQLVHNPVVAAHLEALGAKEGRLDEPGSAETRQVVVTAHGAADQHRRAWVEADYLVADTTCPLVRKAHSALCRLVEAGYFPVVIGKKGHVEVIGLTGDFPAAVVVETAADVAALPFRSRIGVVSQTTQPLGRVLDFVSQIKSRHPAAEVRLIDTVCQPTKDRQEALEQLCRENEVVIVVGGRNSNNTRELAATAARLGARVHQIEQAEEIDPKWFDGVDCVGVTAGTSTLDESVQAVVDRLQSIGSAASRSPGRAWIFPPST